MSELENLTSLMQKCRKRKDGSQAKNMLLYMRNHSLETHSVLGNCLIPVLVDCGCLSDAQNVLDRLPLKNYHSWRSLLCGYISSGDLQHAFDVYHDMKHYSSSLLDSYIYLTLLKPCSELKDSECGRNLHDAIIRTRLTLDSFIGSALADMYAKCGFLQDAQQVLMMLPVRDDVSWNTLIAGYAKQGFIEDVLNCFKQMMGEGLSPSAVTFACSLKACGMVGALKAGQELHCDIVKRGLEAQSYVGNTLVDMYSKCGLLVDAQKAFDRLHVRDKVSWSVLVAGYSEQGLDAQVLRCFKQMQLEAVSGDVATLIHCLHACGQVTAIQSGQEVHAEIGKLNLDRDLPVGNALIDMYARCNLLTQARLVLDTLTYRDAFSWYLIIAGYCRHGLDEEVLNSFDEMLLEGVSPDVGYSLRLSEENSVLACSCSYQSVALIGQDSFDSQLASYPDAVEINNNIFLVVAKACSRLKDIERGQKVHGEIAVKGLEQDLFIGSMLVDMYAKLGLLAEAEDMFNKLVARDTVSWTAIISGYAEEGLDAVVVDCFERMQFEGVPPDNVTVLCSLKAFTVAGALETGQKLNTELIKRGLDREPHFRNMLVSMYAKCGLLLDARQCLDSLPIQDTVSWASLISGYAGLGCYQEVLYCFKQAQLRNVPLDVSTFACCLKACVTMAALEMGREIHAEIRKCELEGDTLLGNMLIDMYCQLGSLVEGEKVFRKLQFRNVVTWTTMIKGYGENHEGSQMAKCFQHMLEHGIKPDAVTFTCLLAACGHAELFDRGNAYFKMMSQEHGVVPTLDHCVCVVDLLARSGYFLQAKKFAESVKCLTFKEVLRALLSACKMYGEVKLGLQCFRQLIQLDVNDASAYSLMAGIYASAGQWAEAHRIRSLGRNMDVNGESL